MRGHISSSSTIPGEHFPGQRRVNIPRASNSYRGVLGPPTRGVHGSRGEPPRQFSAICLQPFLNFRAYLHTLQLQLPRLKSFGGCTCPPCPSPSTRLSYYAEVTVPAYTMYTLDDVRQHFCISIIMFGVLLGRYAAATKPLRAFSFHSE